MAKNILLIDNRVQSYETIVSSINNEKCISVVFDYSLDTVNDIKTKIINEVSSSNLDANAIRCIGLVQHNYVLPLYNLVQSTAGSVVTGVLDKDPALTTWSELRDFISWCKTTPEVNAQYFDMMACALYSDPDWKYVIDTLTTQTGVTVRASTDNTGAASRGGNWFLESHTGINLKDVYFTDLIEEYRGVLFLQSYKIRNYSTKGFATGNIQAWSDSTYGGSAPTTVSDANSGIVAVYSTQGAFVALKTDGSVVAWGGSAYGGTGAPSSVTAANSGVIAVCSTNAAFAALKTDGSVVAWGDSSYGGTGAPSSVTAANSGVVAIYSTYSAFAALKTDGSVAAWGGAIPPSSVTDANSGVVAIYSNTFNFAALKNDGSVVAWGETAPSSVTAANSGVVAVYCASYAFAALKTDGSVVAWGNTTYGGTGAPSSVTAANSGVVTVYSNAGAFAALKSNGTVVAWGSATYGGSAPSSVTAANSGVITVYSNNSAFAALKTDGSVVAWGETGYGGTGAPSSVTAANSGVIAVYSTGGAFAALKTDGSVVVWGDSNHGGTGAPSSVTAANSGVVAVYSTNTAFAALKTDGSVVVWGNTTYGGTGAPSSVTASNSGVITVYSNIHAFAALKTSALTFDLSMSYYTNADWYDILKNPENRRRVNLSTLNNNVFTLSSSRDLRTINPLIPLGTTLKIIVPTYVASSYSITSTATIPNSSGFIVACEESEPVTISGTTYVNYGTYVYKREANNTYTKTTSAIINGVEYTLYGGDGINSSGIVFLATTTLAFVNPPTSKNVTDAPFVVVASSASTGAVTYSSNNVSIATVNASSGLVTLKSAGSVTITASQAASANYQAPADATCSIVIASAGTALQGQTVSSGTSFASVDLSGASLAGTTVAGVSFSGANLRNVNFSGAVITNANFSNANIKGATNLPAFSTVQKLQLLKNINNADIGAVQVTTPVSGSDINALLATPRSEIAAATFTIKAPATVDASANKLVTVNASDVSGNKSIYIPINANETVKINNTVYSFDGTNLLDTTGAVVNYIPFEGKPFKIYAGSVIALNVQDTLNKITITGQGLYNVLSQMFNTRTI